MTSYSKSVNDLGGYQSAQTVTNIGTAGTNVAVLEYGDGYNHISVMTVSAVCPAIAGGAALGVGNLIYTLPAGALIIDGAYISVGLTQSQGNINADTPEVGLGTTIGTGAIAVLSTTMENLVLGSPPLTNCTGTAKVLTQVPTAAVPFVIEVAAVHTVYLNVADTWAASGDAAATWAGTVVLNWRFMA